MNVNLIRLSYCGVVSAVYLMQMTAAQGQVIKNQTKQQTVVTTNTSDLMAQGVTRVTGVELDRTEDGLRVILKTAQGGERLIPLILPKENSLVIDLLDATLGFSIRNGVSQTNPAPGISLIRLDKIDDSSIRLTITGENQTPSVEIVPGRNDLVLSVTPEGTIEREPDESIEVIATGEAEDNDYNITDARMGTRTDTPIQDVPQSIQVIPQEVIEDQQVTNTTDALRNVPGTVPSDSNRTFSNNFTIRGFGGPSSTNDLFRRNGLRDALGAANTGDTANIERIEVFKGPSSVLYGQGSPGGIVNLVTKQPLNEPFYAVEGIIGNYDLYRGTLDISGPLDKNETVLYRLNVAAETSSSFVDFYDRDRYLVNPVLTWNISDKTKLTTEFEYRSTQQLRDSGLPAVGTVLDNPNGDIPLSRYPGDPTIDDRDIDVYRFGYNFEHQFSQKWRIRNAFDAVLSRANSLTIFNRSLAPDGRTLNRSYFDNGDGFDNNAYTLDTYTVGKFNTGSVRHELVAGIELSRNERRSNEGFIGSVAPLDLFAPQYGVALGEPAFLFDNDRTSDGLGIYLQDQVTISDKFIVVLGGRFDILTNKEDNFIRDTNEFQQNEAFSPRVGLVYKPIPDLSLYASYSRSLTQSVGQAFGGGVFDPERGTQYEIGVKGDLSDRLSATLALYDLTRTNVSTQDPNNPNFQIQTGEQNSQGVELYVAGEILPGWNITGGYAYIDAVITEDNLFEEGNRLNNSPENAVSLWTTYEIQQGSLQGLGFGAGLFFVGERQGDLDNSFELPSYTRTDAAIFYKRGKFRTALNFRNLFDIDYFEAADSDLEVFPGEPFAVSGSVSVKF